MNGDFIQIGVIAARAPDGSALPSVPIDTKRTPETEQAEEAALLPVARIFAEKMAEYVKGTKKTSRGSGSEKERCT